MTIHRTPKTSTSDPTPEKIVLKRIQISQTKPVMHIWHAPPYRFVTGLKTTLETPKKTG